MSISDSKIAERLSRISNVILVISGKGGVGKSSVSTQLALSLSSTPVSSQGSSSSRMNRVGLLDIDLTGPSIPRMLGLEGCSITQSTQGWIPVSSSSSLFVISVGFLLGSKNDSVIWRGPKKSAMIKQFLSDVYWGDLDYLIIDTPPGTSDEHISILESLASAITSSSTTISTTTTTTIPPVAVMVTTPQAVSLADNLRSLDFTKKTNLKVLGIIENMSGYVCPHCSECCNVWGKGGGEALADREKLPFLGRIPIDPGLVTVLDQNQTCKIQSYKQSLTFPIFQTITDKIRQLIELHRQQHNNAIQPTA